MLEHVPILPEEQTIPSSHTYNTLARLLKFLDTDTPEALRVNLNARGGLRLGLNAVPGGIHVEVYDGPFALKVTKATKVTEAGLVVNSGWVNRNGEFRSVSGVRLPLRVGTVCVSTHLSSGGSWSSPVVDYSSPGLWSYPIGHVNFSGDWTATSYRVPVAVFLATAVCPLAKKDS